MLRLGSFTLLTDPNFLHRGQLAYLGKGLTSRRLTEPAMGIDALPPLDAVLLSHLHGDHFDRVARRGLDRDVPVVTTPAAARRLRLWGFRTHGLHTWEQHSLERDGETLTVQAMPGTHARGPLRALLPPVMGSLLEHRDGNRCTRVYVTGDTVTGPHLDEIHTRHPDIDVGVVHLGGTRVLFQTVTLDADGGVDLLRRTDPRTVVPVHHSDYGRFRSPLSAFLTAASRAGFGERVRVVAPGETAEL